MLRRTCICAGIAASLVVLLSLDACHVCEAPEVETTATLDVAEGAACPAPNAAKPMLGANVLEVHGPAGPPTPLAGSEYCCYDVDVHESALDEVVQSQYNAGSCAQETVEGCKCVPGSDLLGSAKAASLQFIPEDAVVVTVEAGPTYEYYASCAYRLRVSRPDAIVRKHRCTSLSVAIPSGPASPQLCPPAGNLLDQGVLETIDNDPIKNVVSGPVLERVKLPSNRCVYPVKSRGDSADVCG